VQLGKVVNFADQEAQQGADCADLVKLHGANGFQGVHLDERFLVDRMDLHRHVSLIDIGFVQNVGILYYF